MNTKLIALLAASVATAGAAQAVTFNFQSNGTSTLAGTSLGGSDTALVQYLTPTTGSVYTFVSLTSNFTANFAANSYVGSATGGTGSLVVHDVAANANKTLNFTFNAVLTRVPNNSLSDVGFSSSSFTLSGSGLTGTGTFSGNLKNGLSKSTFISDLTPVPEPASMVALAVGGFGLLRRRRRTA